MRAKKRGWRETETDSKGGGGVWKREREWGREREQRERRERNGEKNRRKK